MTISKKLLVTLQICQLRTVLPYPQSRPKGAICLIAEPNEK